MTAIIGTVLLASFFIVLANIAVELLHAVLDPRVRSPDLLSGQQRPDRLDRAAERYRRLQLAGGSGL